MTEDEITTLKSKYPDYFIIHTNYTLKVYINNKIIKTQQNELDLVDSEIDDSSEI